MSTTDRMSRGYQPNFDLDYRKGHEGEEYVRAISDGLANGTVETKTDERAYETGNVYLEYQCFKDGDWEPSGIAASTSLTFAIVLGVGDLLVAVRTDVLLVAARRSRSIPGRRRSCMRGSHPTRGVVIPTNELLRDLMHVAREDT